MVRGQAYTLEAFMAALLLLGAVVFALEVTAVTPLTASTSSQHIENQQGKIAGGLLDAAAENDSLKEAVLYWNQSAGRFQDANEEEGYYATGGPPIQFGAMLNRTFRDRGIAFNVYLWHVTTTGELRREQMVRFGSPSDHAVSTSRIVTLYDDDTLTGETSKSVSQSGTFYASDFSSDDGVFNVVRVEVVVWRM